MKVAVSLPDEAGSGHYRARYPARIAESEGCEIEFVSDLKLRVRDGGLGVAEVTGLDGVPDWDAIVMARPLRRLNVEAIPFLQAEGIGVIVDLDDDFSCIDPAHAGWKHYQPKTSPESNREWLALACKMADMVTVTTPALADRYGKHGRVKVLPNCVNEDDIVSLLPRPQEKAGHGTVGWAGYVQTHPRDLRETRGGVAMACHEAGARFLNVGDGEDVQKQLDLRDVPFAVTGPVPFDQYPRELRRFDVGIVPLHDTKFNQAKSPLKGLEYAAAGVPFVASPTPAYERLAIEGIGLLAEPKSKHWKRKVLTCLGPDGDELRQMAQEAVRDAHTYEKNGWRWVEAWAEAMFRASDVRAAA